MGDLTGKLKVPLERIFSDSGMPMFRCEPFESVSKSCKKGIPTGELLLRTGESGEKFFSDAHDSGVSFELDKVLFPRAAKLAQLFPRGASVNVHTGTPYEKEFIEILKELKAIDGFDPSKVLIEVTEWGEISSDAKETHLGEILKLGFRLAVDDIDSRDASNMERVHHINGAAVMHKYSYKTMQQIRSGGDEGQEALTAISALKSVYPKAAIVMEGVTQKDRKHFPALVEAGVTVVQFYHPAVS